MEIDGLTKWNPKITPTRASCIPNIPRIKAGISIEMKGANTIMVKPNTIIQNTQTIILLISIVKRTNSKTSKTTAGVLGPGPIGMASTANQVWVPKISINIRNLIPQRGRRGISKGTGTLIVNQTDGVIPRDLYNYRAGLMTRKRPVGEIHSTMMVRTTMMRSTERDLVKTWPITTPDNRRITTRNLVRLRNMKKMTNGKSTSLRATISMKGAPWRKSDPESSK